MSATVSVTETEVLTALRAFLLLCVPDGTEVIRGVQNRVPQPAGPFVLMTPLNQVNPMVPWSAYDRTVGTRNFQTMVKAGMQIDCFGPLSGDWAATIVTLFRSEYAVSNLAPTCAPLYCEDPVQSPFEGGEMQQDERWTFTAILQYNPVVTVTQDFATAANVGLINVNGTYPPGA